MDWMHLIAKVYSLILIVVGAVLLYMSVMSQAALGEFWMYFAGLGAFFFLVGLIGLIARLTRKSTV